MSHSNDELDAMLQELGIDPAVGTERPGARPPTRPASTEPRKRHSLDAAAVQMPVPAEPTGSGQPSGPPSRGDRPLQEPITESADDAHGGMGGDDSERNSPADRASPTPPRQARGSTVGNAMSNVYQPESSVIAMGEGLPDDASDDLPPIGDLGEWLLKKGEITAQQLSAAQQVVKQTPGKSIGPVLIEQGVDEASVQRGVAAFAGLTFEHIDLTRGFNGGFDGGLLQRLTNEFCKQRLVLPLRTENNRVVVGIVRPSDVFLLDEVRRKLGVSAVKPVVVTGFEIRGALEIAGDKGEKAESNIDVNNLLKDVADADVQVDKKNDTEVDLEKEAGGSPVIRYVNHIIQTAVKEGASDIHIEPSEHKLKVRFRIDGELYEMMNPPVSMAAAITSRLKIMGNLDISERRMPQDGRIRCMVQSRKLDLRLSTLPVVSGEKIVMRILDTRSINVKLEDLGFDPDILGRWKGLVDMPHGIVLVTGPTGSGKTTTLYASIRQLDKNSMNISTVEDPVEYHLDGINQTQTHEKISMTFAKALKALLRQDPDVIMVGEIRDHETALTAVQAALTGHLVLSTLHTNDAAGSITRLVNIGLEPFLVAAAVNGVLAQRLLRRLCKHCKIEATPNEEMAEFLKMQGLNPEKQWSPKGCDRCRSSGYSGRVGIYELLCIDDGLRDVIVRNPNVAELRRLCMERGMVTLRQDGLKKANSGLTSVEEVLRITEANI